jgi:biofilm PGA synthesis N-glycosyltransferase PgaC
VFVLTGTASLFRSAALAAVATARGSVLPGDRGDVYDTYSLTEDNELTIALKTLGASMVSPRRCRVRTELMPTWRDLWHQRQRWQRGALENIGMYGLSSATARYWAQQFALLIELGYATLLQAVDVKSLIDIALGRSKHWNAATVSTPPA